MLSLYLIPDGGYMIKVLLGILLFTHSASAGVSLTNRGGSGLVVYDYILVTVSDGHGSTNTAIPKLTTEATGVTVDNGGITYANAADVGASFTINKNGVASACFSNNSGTVDEIGISKNSSQLTTAIGSITITDRMCLQTIGNNTAHSVCCTFPVSAGDVIRPHDDGSPGGTALAQFHMTLIQDGT